MAILLRLPKWGCELRSDGSPWVAHRVWPIPRQPLIERVYPLYSNLRSPSKRMGTAFSLPTYPMMPHIDLPPFLGV